MSRDELRRPQPCNRLVLSPGSGDEPSERMIASSVPAEGVAAPSPAAPICRGLPLALSPGARIPCQVICNIRHEEPEGDVHVERVE